MFLAGDMRPDISYAMSKLSRFTSNPGDDYWKALEQVLHYLRGTNSFGIHYSGYPSVLEGYSDSNWISDADDTKATVAMYLRLPVLQFCGGLVNKPC
jgi:hypothetical protein